LYDSQQESPDIRHQKRNSYGW